MMDREIKIINSDEEAMLMQPAKKNRRIKTGLGFYLFISTNGVKSWRYNYRFQGKRATINLGQLPQTSRDTAYLYKKAYVTLIKKGIDPGIIKKLEGTWLDLNNLILKGNNEK